MYSNNIVNFQESTIILKAHTKTSLETYWRHHVLLYKQISSDLFENKITYKLLTYKSYEEPFNWMQTNKLWLI